MRHGFWWSEIHFSHHLHVIVDSQSRFPVLRHLQLSCYGLQSAGLPIYTTALEVWLILVEMKCWECRWILMVLKEVCSLRGEAFPRSEASRDLGSFATFAGTPGHPSAEVVSLLVICSRSLVIYYCLTHAGKCWCRQIANLYSIARTKV